METHLLKEKEQRPDVAARFDLHVRDKDVEALTRRVERLDRLERHPGRPNARRVHDHAHRRRTRVTAEEAVRENLGERRPPRRIATEAPTQEVLRVTLLLCRALRCVVGKQHSKSVVRRARPRRETHFVVDLDHVVVADVLREERATRAQLKEHDAERPDVERGVRLERRLCTTRGLNLRSCVCRADLDVC